jgi:hypothetical protein
MTSVAVVAIDDAGNRSMIASADDQPRTIPPPVTPSTPVQPLARTGGSEPLMLLAMVICLALMLRRKVS